MPLSAGQQLGTYQIVSLLGKGGMGEVYRARDSKLNREVAIKILPTEFTNDEERIARFHREAQSIAALNHSNIAAIYELAEAGTTRFLVLELVEGETLADRLVRGALPVPEALSIAKQILEALEAAYEKGIVHRDLKPANVKITPEGKVKVLDFGLAKAREESASNVALSNSPTLTLGSTNPGVILGTAGYMSPEQAKGFAVDHRSDLFSFGCVLYEMLTGKQAFPGETVSEIIASVLKTEPDFSMLPPKLSPRLVESLRRCLAKNPKNRWHAAADLRAELEWSDKGDEGSAPSSPSRYGWKHAAILLIGLVLLGGLVDDLIQWRTRTSQPQMVSRFSILLPPDTLNSNFANRVLSISPDGTQIAYQSNQKVFLRSISEFEAKPIPGAEDTIATTDPTFSPDGRSLAYWSVGRGGLVTIPTTGGTPSAILSVDGLGIFGYSWSRDGILFSESRNPVRLVSENGGEPKVVVASDPKEFLSFPKVLPGGRAILFSLTSNNRVQLVAQSLDSGKRTILLDRTLEGSETSLDAHYVPTGHLLYGFGGTVFVVPLDLAQLKVTGAPVPVIPGVREASSGELELSFSANGTLVYIPGPQTGATQFDLALQDGDAAVQPLKLPPRSYQTLRVSPDGKRVAFAIDEGNETNIWLYDFNRPNAPNRLTFGGKNRFPVWSADGQWVAFQSDREGDLGIFRQRSDGSGAAERLTKPEKGAAHVPESWSPKADVLLFRAIEGSDVSLWSFNASDKKSALFGDIKSLDPPNATFSPDGKWVAYNMRAPDKARDEVYVQPFPATGARYQVPISRDNHHPVWSRDGKHLFYIAGPGEYSSIDVTTSPTFTFGTPKPIRQQLENYAPSAPRQYDAMPDGKLIGLIPAQQSQSANVATQINVVLNWFEELKQRVPVK